MAKTGYRFFIRKSVAIYASLISLHIARAYLSTNTTLCSLARVFASTHFPERATGVMKSLHVGLVTMSCHALNIAIFCDTLSPLLSWLIILSHVLVDTPSKW